MGQLKLGVEPVGRILSRPLNTLGHRTVADIQRNLDKWGKRSAVSQHFHAKNDKEKIAAWKSELDRILQVFNVRSVT